MRIVGRLHCSRLDIVLKTYPEKWRNSSFFRVKPVALYGVNEKNLMLFLRLERSQKSKVYLTICVVFSIWLNKMSISSFICSLSIMSEILTVCHSIKGLHRVFWSQLLVKFISQLSIKISAYFLAISEFSRSWPVSTIRYKKLHNSADSPLNLLIWYFLCVTFSIQDIGKKSFEERKVIAGDRGFMILSRTFYT